MRERWIEFNPDREVAGEAFPQPSQSAFEGGISATENHQLERLLHQKRDRGKQDIDSLLKREPSDDPEQRKHERPGRLRQPLFAKQRLLALRFASQITPRLPGRQRL